jgi:hypothetical protein
MRIAYVEIKRGFPVNTDMMCAIEGFEYLGYDIKTFTREDILSNKFFLLYNKVPFIGSIDSITKILESLNKLPASIDYPETNTSFLGREITTSKMDVVIQQFLINKKPIFIKPVKRKLFDGSVLSSENRISYFEPYLAEDVFCSPVLDIVSEWRAYVHNGVLKDCKHYNKDFTNLPDYNTIKLNIEAFKNAPIAYTIDIAILKNNSSIVMEFNDFWSIGSYGLDPEIYAEMLLDRWFEIVKN